MVGLFDLVLQDYLYQTGSHSHSMATVQPIRKKTTNTPVFTHVISMYILRAVSTAWKLNLC